MNRILVAITIVLTFQIYSQTQGVSYQSVGRGVATTFVTDYQTLGINSSALGWGTGFENKHLTFGSSEMAFGIYSDQLTVDKLRSLSKAIRNQIVGKENDESTWTEQKEYAVQYANSGLDISVQYNWFGFAAQYEKFGGIAFNINEDYHWYSKLNENTTGILFEGKLANYFDSLTVVFGTDTSRIANHDNLSQDTLQAAIMGTISNPLSIASITEGSSIKARWDRNYNFGYGRKLFGKDSVFVLYGGIGGRFIQSIALFEYESSGSGARFYSSISPTFGINYGSVAATNPSASGDSTGWFPKSVGNGYGIDLSASAKIFNKLTISAAVNNIGQVTYERDVYTLIDTLVGDYSLEGLDDENITQSMNSLLKDGGLFNLQGKEKYKVNNASNFRVGASLEIKSMIRVGADVVMPFDPENPGSIVNPVISFGGDIRPLPWITIAAGYYGGGIYKSNIPMGVTFHLKEGMYEFGVASRDMLSFVMNNSNTVSGAFGFLRFRI